ncbi:hypothetical protein QUB80_17680 [Chlorogloeopsis sp. ULAP01]|uniref:hypothetical protein n=1 Tax=Chlorogloeopsis sp. ULAP01 TaxID=3056483 RepID=UPI0025AACCC6|nr:hypothetical protein [Chlorogloeopsis sp. ULAP01]MDM9382534.1 hypothetical protein [Chlorogloeopsis sp. ULAP01]
MIAITCHFIKTTNKVNFNKQNARSLSRFAKMLTQNARSLSHFGVFRKQKDILLTQNA